MSSHSIECPKCKHEHEPAGSHDDDAGEMTCEHCGFEFRVDIDYDPSYITSCVKHEYGPYEKIEHKGETYHGRFCAYCEKFDLRQD